jgi:hypothetical protein
MHESCHLTELFKGEEQQGIERDLQAKKKDRVAIWTPRRSVATV